MNIKCQRCKPSDEGCATCGGFKIVLDRNNCPTCGACVFTVEDALELNRRALAKLKALENE